MTIFNVYTKWPVEPVRGKGCNLWDAEGNEYLDFYGGHAVISIGHCHPVYVKMMEEQTGKLGFYSNAVVNSLQERLAEEFGEISGYPDYSLFLSNSGAEANENALKLASFHTGRKKVLAFGKAFHGRTGGAVSVTDNPGISSPFNATPNIAFVPLNDIEAVEKELGSCRYAAAIIEGVQGVAGIRVPDDGFLKSLRALCTSTGTMLIIDEVQSGCGRTGSYFAHSRAGVRADIITAAKGIGNGFPIGATFISPDIKAVTGMLGTTFGGNQMACTAALAVLKVIKDEHLMANAKSTGEYLASALRNSRAVDEVRGRGLMIGLEINAKYSGLRDMLLFEKHIFTGASGKNVIRLLPPLCAGKREADRFIESFEELTK